MVDSNRCRYIWKIINAKQEVSAGLDAGGKDAMEMMIVFCSVRVGTDRMKVPEFQPCIRKQKKSRNDTSTLRGNPNRFESTQIKSMNRKGIIDIRATSSSLKKRRLPDSAWMWQRDDGWKIRHRMIKEVFKRILRTLQPDLYMCQFATWLT